jgi:hypothetical protein
MTKHIVFRIVAGLVLLAAIAGIAFFAFNAGVTRGAVTNLPAPSVENGVAPFPYFGHYGMPFHFFGFGCFAPLAVLFLVCLAFGSMRRMFWGPRWGGHFMHRHHGPWGERSSDEFVPPMFKEWHTRAHAAPEKPADEAAQK